MGLLLLLLLGGGAVVALSSGGSAPARNTGDVAVRQQAALRRNPAGPPPPPTPSLPVGFPPQVAEAMRQALAEARSAGLGQEETIRRVRQQAQERLSGLAASLGVGAFMQATQQLRSAISMVTGYAEDLVQTVEQLFDEASRTIGAVGDAINRIMRNPPWDSYESRYVSWYQQSEAAAALGASPGQAALQRAYIQERMRSGGWRGSALQLFRLMEARCRARVATGQTLPEFNLGDLWTLTNGAPRWPGA